MGHSLSVLKSNNFSRPLTPKYQRYYSFIIYKLLELIRIAPLIILEDFMKRLSIAALAAVALAAPAFAQTTTTMPSTPTNKGGQKYQERFEERQKAEQEIFQKRQAIEQKYFQKHEELYQQEHGEMEQLREEMMRNHPGMDEHMGGGQQGGMDMGSPGGMNGGSPNSITAGPAGGPPPVMHSGPMGVPTITPVK